MKRIKKKREKKQKTKKLKIMTRLQGTCVAVTAKEGSCEE